MVRDKDGIFSKTVMEKRYSKYYVPLELLR